MPYTIRLEPESGILLGTGTGVLKLKDAREAAMAVWRKPEWAGRPLVWDFRSAELDFQGPEVRDMARFVLERQPATPPPRLAFVTGREADYGIVRIFEVLSEHPATQVRAFRDHDEAVAWARSGDPGPG